MPELSFSKTISGDLLANLPKHLRYARASEASTLFLNEPFDERPPYLRISETADGVFMAEDFDGKTLHNFYIARVTAKNQDLIVELVPVQQEPHNSTALETTGTRFYTIYPYRDIDDTFVVIQAIPGMDEKPVRWAISAEFANRIEIMPEGFP